MGLSIKKMPSGLYQATATPPHVKDAWTTPKPLTAREVMKELEARGWHQQHIGDALYEQDPNWVEKLG